MLATNAHSAFVANILKPFGHVSARTQKQKEKAPEKLPELLLFVDVNLTELSKNLN
ncbi:hypothetical protein [Dictyobacter kobayashii]|nr:hypothetical protein [Dictyobacter kobayashii]